MTKKDYELIARALRGHLTQWREDEKTDKADAVISMANRLADDFANLNPRFNRQTFLRACGVEVK